MVGQDSLFINNLISVMGGDIFKYGLLVTVIGMVLAIVFLYFKNKNAYVKYFYQVINQILLALKDKQITRQQILNIIQKILGKTSTDIKVQQILGQFKLQLSDIKQQKRKIK